MPRDFVIALVAFSLAAAPTWCGAQGTAPPRYEPDATLASTPSNVVWGHLPTGVPPALTIKSGEAVDFVQMVYGDPQEGLQEADRILIWLRR